MPETNDIAALIETVKSLTDRVAQLENRVNTLESREKDIIKAVKAAQPKPTLKRF